MTVAELDTLPEAAAAGLLESCCGSQRWVAAMFARRPFRSLARLEREAGEAWRGLAPADWLEAFAHHPRLGERDGALPQSDRGSAWSAGEQAGVTAAGDPARQALAKANREYEARFGYIYVVCAAGRPVEELIGAARARLSNDPDTELKVAAEEQLKITLLRLRNLLNPES